MTTFYVAEYNFFTIRTNDAQLRSGKAFNWCNAAWINNKNLFPDLKNLMTLRDGLFIHSGFWLFFTRGTTVSDGLKQIKKSEDIQKLKLTIVR